MKRISLKVLLPIVVGLLFLFFTFGPAYDPDYRQDVEDAKNMPVDEFLLDRLERGAEEINLDHYYLTNEAFQDVWQAVLYNHPELFYVSSSCQYTASDLKLYRLIPEYTMNEAERTAAKTDYALALEDVLREVDAQWSDLETALYLHDWVALHSVYDESTAHYTAYDLFTLGTGVCQAYAQAYQALLTECGIPCRFVLSEEMDHAWVIVQLDGAWYHVDVTHDDPVFDRQGHVSHAYFLRSDDAIAADHFGGSVPYKCTSTAYDDAVWSTVDSAFVPLNGAFYCISGNQICRWEESGLSPVYTIRDLWYVNGDPYSYWDGCFSSLGTDGTGLLFNTPDAVLRYDLAGGTVSTLYAYDGANDLYGFTYEDNTLTCQVAPNPNEPGECVTAKLS